MTPLFKKKNLFSNVILLWQNDLENYHHFQLHAHSHRPCQSWPQNRAYFLVSNKWHSIKILMKDKKWLRIFFIIRLITVFLRSFSFKFTMLLFVAHSLSLSIIAFFQPKKKRWVPWLFNTNLSLILATAQQLYFKIYRGHIRHTHF